MQNEHRLIIKESMPMCMATTNLHNWNIIHLLEYDDVMTSSISYIKPTTCCDPAEGN